jgi:hypothetical protein
VEESLGTLIAAVRIITFMCADMIMHGIDFGFGGVAIRANVLADFISFIAPACGHGNKQQCMV